MRSAEKQEQISRCQSEIQCVNGRISDHRCTLSGIEGKLSRLRQAAAFIHQYKDQACEWDRKIILEVEEQHEKWRGENHDIFIGSLIEIQCESYSFCEKIDDIEDAINTEIMKLENQIFEQNGLIGQLQIMLNHLETTLINLVN